MNRHPELRSQRDQDHQHSLRNPLANRSTQPSPALTGAALAFGHATAPNQRPSATKESYGAKAAAAAAGFATHERGLGQPANDTPIGPSVKDQIRSIERTKTFTNASLQPTSSVAHSNRRSAARSPSYIAAQLASLKLAAEGHTDDSSRHVEGEERNTRSSTPRSKQEEDAMSTNGAAAPDNGTLPHIIAPKPVRVLSIGQPSVEYHASEDARDTNFLDAKPAPQPLPGAALEAAIGAFARSPSRAPSVSVQSDISRSSSVSRPRASFDIGPNSNEVRRSLSLAGQKPAPAPNRGFRPSPPVNTFEEPMKNLLAQSSSNDVTTAGHTRVSEFSPWLDQKTGLTETALADAMVASSLASSRAPSPHKQLSRPPPPPRHPSKSRNLLQRMVDSEDARSTSLKKALKQTLRKHPKSDDEDEDKQDAIRRGRRHLIRKHHRKHHEGDRKKWRDEVTQRQRKRYEGVWAANKGLYMDSLKDVTMSATGRAHTDLVLNMVVRDIWKRSRLPDDVLEEVWNLVDRGGIGALGRDEFVVGMWLIDQRLRGRKLPIRVSYSVWASVRHSIGLQVG